MEKYEPLKQEPEILKFWKDNRIYEKVKNKNKGKKPWSFIDGPITANNPMGVHHAWGRTYKDVYQRFKAMQGFDQRYQNGFDCQGLWLEVETEKELGFNSKKQIQQYGLDKFSKACRARVAKFSKIQTQQSIRMGQWMDWENSYYTMSDTNIGYIWHFLKKCHEKGWLYKGSKVIPWCYRCGTSLAQHELADSYKEISHTAVYFRVPIKGKNNEFLLLWSTTPWTFTANVAAAVNPELEYVKVKKGNEIYYLSEKAFQKLGLDYAVLDTFKGKKLLELEYEGPFDYLPVQKGIKHRIIEWKDVTGEEGTGIVHIAPGCGVEDNELGKRDKLAEVTPLDEEGNYVEGFEWLTGKNVKDISGLIIKDLEKNGFLYKTEKYKHRYPLCWRCKEEIVFRLDSAWFISSAEIRPLMKTEAKKIRWCPEHGGKLMQDWLNNMGDWNISRKRFWGLPLMFFECSCQNTEVIGSLKELKEKAVNKKEVEKLPELHRPWIDKIKIKCPKCSKEIERIEDIGDCWLDAGIVPFSTLKYLEDKSYWNKWFPADLIIEMREQVRLWFYSLLFMSVTLVNKAPYKSVLLYEKVNDETGKPMHKSLGNAIWFDEAVEKMGVDVMRWIYSMQNPQFNLNFGYTPAKETKRNIEVIRNLGNYIKTYCKNTGKESSDIASKWITSKRESLKQDVTNHLENLEPHLAMAALKDYFLKDLSRTYGQIIRGNLDNKTIQAVLYNSFLDGLKLLSPFLPFITEKLYQEIYKNKQSIFLEDWPKPNKKMINKELEEEMDNISDVIQTILALREKLQLGVRWPLQEAIVVTKDKKTVKAVERLKNIIKKQTNIKELEIQQSLPGIKENIKADYSKLGPDFGKKAPQIIAKLTSESSETILSHIKKEGKFTINLGKEKVNIVKEHLIVTREVPAPYIEGNFKNGFVYLNKDVDEELEAEGYTRELMRRIQELRKNAGLEKADRISLFIKTDEELMNVLNNFHSIIKEKVGASTLKISNLEPSKKHKFESKEKVRDKKFELFLEKV
jgi:isoleucyl-tRNA synthetase